MTRDEGAEADCHALAGTEHTHSPHPEKSRDSNLSVPESFLIKVCLRANLSVLSA